MKILAIDTSSIVATCAIMDDDKLIGEYILNQGRTHSQKIMPIIKELLDNCELKPEDIDLFAAAKGPGSFTGLRIGIATIKALAHVNDKKVVGIPTIDALAFNVPYSKGIVVPMMDARRDRVYSGIYKWESGGLSVIREQDVIEVDELIDILNERNERIIVNGDGGNVYREKLLEGLKNEVVFAPKSCNIARASSLCELAFSKVEKGELESYLTLTPQYLRKSQAERQYDEKCGVDNGCNC
ncbi:tRNA (adenosine(37)-N6)-threonylcarbamoyltransferase complex dimerization subunit type 1 TsaB [Dethiothermospora halolimnae]|uniref:tRNA (adenosine(37)-N6)-threonylcarbamoyltransferase complex dimerization subunit type 1 TsaB n=1 Tax=Dethiothermospora halolimnae TaxID=3114390 RepID=UPI003CCBB3F4